MINKLNISQNSPAFGAKLNIHGGGSYKDLCDQDLVDFIKVADKIGNDRDKIDIYVSSLYKNELGEYDRDFETKAIIGNKLIRDNVTQNYETVLYSPASAIYKYLKTMAELYPKKD